MTVGATTAAMTGRRITCGTDAANAIPDDAISEKRPAVDLVTYPSGNVSTRSPRERSRDDSTAAEFALPTVPAARDSTA